MRIDRNEEHGQTVDRFLSSMGIAVLAFIGGSLFGYLWMAHA